MINIQLISDIDRHIDTSWYIHKRSLDIFGYIDSLASHSTGRLVASRPVRLAPTLVRTCSAWRSKGWMGTVALGSIARWEWCQWFNYVQFPYPVLITGWVEEIPAEWCPGDATGGNKSTWGHLDFWVDDGGWLKNHHFLQAAQARRARPAAVVAEAVEGPPGGMAEVAVHAHFGHQAGHLGAPLRSPTSPAQVTHPPWKAG